MGNIRAFHKCLPLVLQVAVDVKVFGTKFTSKTHLNVPSTQL